MQNLVDFHCILLLGAQNIGGNPCREGNAVVFKTADDNVGIANINR